MNAESTPDLEEERQKNGKEGEELSRQVELLEEKRSDLQKHLQSDDRLVCFRRVIDA